MNRPLLDKLVETVLYEGHILYPYRSSSKKNQQRFTFGRVYPRAYSEAQRGAEPCMMQTECLVEATAEDPSVLVEVRFLQPIARELGRRPAGSAEWSEGVAHDPQLVSELSVDGNLLKPWQEASEQIIAALHLAWDNSNASGSSAKVSVDTCPRGIREPRKHVFSIPASQSYELVKDSQGYVQGVISRRQAGVEGEIELWAEPFESRLSKIRVRISNLTPMEAAELADPEAVLMRTFASTHTILQAQGARFISSIDVPSEYKLAAARCRNVGTWPVLVGDEMRLERDVMLSSPIILYDYPKIAPQSAGPLFDGTEIDEILTLRIMAMTDEEKREARLVDEQARRLLERTELLDQFDMLRMHGGVREVGSLDKEVFGGNEPVQGVTVGGVYVRAGDRVRLCPKAQADIMDIVLNGKTAVVESVEQDAESRIHLAVVVEDDPGKDLGLKKLSGHRL